MRMAALFQEAAAQPQGYVSQNIARLGIAPSALEQMPLLDKQAYFLCSDEPDEDATLEEARCLQQRRTWGWFLQAHTLLQTRNLLSFPSTLEERMQTQLGQFIEKAQGPTRIPVHQLQGVIQSRTKRDSPTMSHQVHYNGFVHLIEEHYALRARDIFGKFGQDLAWLGALAGMDARTFAYASNRPASDSPHAALSALLLEAYDRNNSAPYVDTWHYHLRAYFAQVFNGCVLPMPRPGDEERSVAAAYARERTQETGIVVDSRMLSLFDHLFFKELDQLIAHVWGEAPASIDFHLAW